MIKRPLVWVFCSYLCGMLLTWYQFPKIFLILLILISCSLIYLMLYRSDQRLISRRDSFLWALPAVYILGCFAMGSRMEPAAPEQAFGEKAECTLTGKVALVVEKQQGRVLYLQNNSVNITGENYPVENIIVYSSDNQYYRIGNRVTVSGSIRKFSTPSNPGQFNEKMYYKIQNIDYKVLAENIQIVDFHYSGLQLILHNFKQKLIGSFTDILPSKEAGVLIYMLLGDKYLLDEEVRQLYQENGIAHILAISGLHISLLGISLYLFLRKCKAGLIPSTLLSGSLVYAYGLLTDFSVSTNRAVVMFIVMLLARLLGKTYDMLSALSLSAFLILLNNPMQLFSAGFLLSFSAVLGMTVLTPCLHKLFPMKSSLANALFVSLSAQLATIPLILNFFYQLPVYSLLINLLILPLMSILMLSAIAAGIIGLFSLPLSVFLIGGANSILKLIEILCRAGSSLPGNLYTVGKPKALQILIYLILLICFVWTAGRFKKKKLLLLPLLALSIILIPKTSISLTITMLDVGQGEAILIKSPTGTTYLMDGGSSDIGKVGTYRIQPYLLASGIDHIDYAFVSHADGDHVNGILELIEDDEIKLKYLVLPGIQTEKNKTRSNTEELDLYETLETTALNHQIRILYMKKGDLLREDKLILTCLHPPEEFVYSSENAYSMVLSLSYGSFDMLLTGDLEQTEEQLLYEELKDYDLLKVAHHGSRNSTGEEYLAIIKPDYALISCGKGNRYGHPHEELLERLEQTGSEIFITRDSGAVTITTNGKSMKVSEYK